MRLDHVIHSDPINLVSPQLISARLSRFPTGNLCNANADVVAMAASISALFSGARIAGPAVTARISPGQNAAIHRAIHHASPGHILVVEGRGNTTFGSFGDILATACQKKGLEGAVLDASVRDSAEIRKLGFPVFCVGTHPAAPNKTDPGDIDIDIRCGGVRVRPGDFVIGDDDGVVVVPGELAMTILEQVEDVARREEKILSELDSGRSTVEIFGLDP